ncbi:MAG: exonuclease SbcCD subunit D [Syntrophomonadaceae bacterium]|jgi:exonuclease SbcD
MRIIHTADWHLGRSLHGHNLIEEQAHVLLQFINLAKESKIDAIIIAGDVFDRSQPPAEAVSLLNMVLTSLCQELKIPTIVIAGNHDNPERIGFAQQMLLSQQLYMVGPLQGFWQPIRIDDQYGPVYFCPLPYADPAFIRYFTGNEQIHDHHAGLQAMVQHLTAALPASARRVAIAHAFISGGEESESERPLTAVGGAGQVPASIFVPFHYSALGHLHGPQNVGKEQVRYAGSLLKYSFAEAEHHKGITMLEIDVAGKILSLENIPLSPRREVRCIEGFMEEILKGPPAGESRDDYVKVILLDEGALLDPMGKLRQVYPNLLELQRPTLNSIPDNLGSERDFRNLSEVDLFNSFYQQVTGCHLSEHEGWVLARLIDEFYIQERGA